MNLTITKEQIANGLQAVQNVVSAPVKAAAPDPARAAAAAPASTKLPRPAPQTKTTKSSTSGGKIAAGPKTDTTETK